MTGCDSYFDNPRVVPFSARPALDLKQRLQTHLPARSRVELVYHAAVDARSGIALRLTLPERPNPCLPGRNRPPSAPFVIEVAHALVDAAGDRAHRLADWIATQIASATLPTGVEADTPLLWRFTPAGTRTDEIQSQRLPAPTAGRPCVANG